MIKIIAITKYFKIFLLIIFKKKEPKKLYILKKSDIGQLIIFEYLVYIKIPKKRKKSLNKKFGKRLELNIF